MLSWHEPCNRSWKPRLFEWWQLSDSQHYWHHLLPSHLLNLVPRARKKEKEPWERGCHLPGALGDVIAVICAAATSLTSLIGIDIFGTIGILCSSNSRWNCSGNRKPLQAGSVENGNRNETRLHGFGQIFERSNWLARIRLSLHGIGGAVQIFLNDKLCKVFSWSEVGQDFGQVWFHC